KLLEVVGDVRTQIVAACTQLAGRQFLIADIEQQERLDAVDLAFVAPVKLVLDDVEKLAMKPFNEVERFEIEFRFDPRAFEHSCLRFGKCRHWILPTRGPTIVMSLSLGKIC